MNIIFNTNYKNAGTMICVDDLSKRFLQDGHEVEFNDWENYTRYDIAFFMAPDSDVLTAKTKNPDIICGIMDPKLTTKKQREQVCIADFLGVSSIEQKEAFLPYNKNIFIYYMFPDIKQMQKEHSPKKKITIGYHGNKLHLQSMAPVTAALDQLSEKYDIELLAMYNHEGLGKWKIGLPKKCPVRHVQWSEKNYIFELGQADIGIVPAAIAFPERQGKFFSRFLSSYIFNWPGYFRDDYLVRFKYSTNPGRAYIFSQLGIPVIADFLPSYCQLIQDGESGCLVYSQEGWYNALEKLILSHELRNSLSNNLRKFINQTCSPHITYLRFNTFLTSLKK